MKIFASQCVFLMAWLPFTVAAADEPPANTPPANGPALDPGPYCVTSKPRRKLSITVTHELPAMQGVVYFPLPPDTASQQITACKLSVVAGNRKLQSVKAFDASQLKKPVQEVVLKQRIGGQAIVELEIDMFAARLEPGSPDEPIRKLKGTERTSMTAPDWHYEYDSAPFRRWMADNSLTRGKAERDADFALRVLEFIRRNFEYKIVDPRQIHEQITGRQMSELVYYTQEKVAECWGLSSVYTSVLRASAIPCRQMSGFVLEPRPLRRGSHHVRAEVYLEGTGWILVEVAGAVTARNEPLLNFFGHGGDDMVLIDQGINYRLAGPKEQGPKEQGNRDYGNIGTLSGFAIGNANGEWSFPYAKWEIKTRE